MLNVVIFQACYNSFMLIVKMRYNYVFSKIKIKSQAMLFIIWFCFSPTVENHGLYSGVLLNEKNRSL